MRAPVVHWVPKGPWRRRAIKLALRTGRAADYFTDHSLEERTEIFTRYSESETFYRSPREIVATLEAAHLKCDLQSATQIQLEEKLGATSPPTQRRPPGPTAICG